VFLPEDAQIWFNVQTETLKRVHSSWLPGVPIDLLTQARKLALGRRWLAKRLSVASPVLFGLPVDLDSAAVARLKAAAWLAPLVADPLECALELGMVERLIRCGAAEFAGLADSLHPAWGESVRLTYERSWWFDASSPSLSAAAAETCLRVGVLH
jgi:hypothetical protein